MFGSAFAGGAPPPQPPAYALVKAESLGAPSRWDYLVFDSASHRLYVSHGARVTVLDGRTGAALGEITGMPGGTHGVALTAAAGKGYTDDGEAGLAVAFDPVTFQTGARIAVDPDADGITLDPSTGHVFVIEGDSAKIAVIDPATDKVIARILGGGKLEYAVADGRGNLYVNGAERREILRIDTRTNAIDARWPVPTCASPLGLAIDAAGRRLFSSCVNGVMMVLDADSGRSVASLPIGRGTDAAAFDPKRKRVFSSNGFDGDITVYEQQGLDVYRPLPSIKTAVTGRTMDLDPETGRLFVAVADVDQTQPKGAPAARTVKVLFLDPVQ